MLLASAGRSHNHRPKNITHYFNSSAPDAACTRLILDTKHNMVNLRVPGQSLARPLGIVHVPKTGGTAINSISCPDLRCATGHSADAYFWRRLGLESFGIIRDPMARFVSQFWYLKLGSEMGNKGSLKYKPFLDARAFADSLADPDAPLHGRAVTQFRSRNAYRRQIDILASPLATRVHVACYAEDNSPALLRLLTAVGSQCPAGNLPVVRRTGTTNASTGFVELGEQRKSPALLSVRSRLWLMEHYRADLELYDVYCGGGVRGRSSSSLDRELQQALSRVGAALNRTALVVV